MKTNTTLLSLTAAVGLCAAPPKMKMTTPVPDGVATPDGYVRRTVTRGHWVVWRGFQVGGSTGPAVDATKRAFRLYSLSEASGKPAMNFINVSGKYHNTIHRMDFGIYDEINEVIQRESILGADQVARDKEP